MGVMPREPEAFAETVATMLRKLQPEYSINLVGPRELLVNGRRLDLENLYRMVNHEPTISTSLVSPGVVTGMVPSLPSYAGLRPTSP